MYYTNIKTGILTCQHIVVLYNKYYANILTKR